MVFVLGEYRIEGRRAVEIAASVERAVGAGELHPGQPLPPMRELAVHLGVNPNTVAAAYRTLRERGVIETAGRRGSRVRPKPATTGREQARLDVPPGVRDLSDGNPDPALLPSLAPALAAAAEEGDRHKVLYGDEPVDPRLARLVRAEFDADGVPDGPLTVVSGAMDAVERVLAAHLKPGDTVAVEDPGWGRTLDLVSALGLRSTPVGVDGDTVAVEDPGWGRTLDLVSALGLRTTPVGVDDEGPLADDVRRALVAGARALIVTDRAQNPFGASVSASRAHVLRAVLREHPQTLLVEDDHGHGIVDLPLSPLAGATRRWAFVRSVAKAYGPDLRLALLTGDTVTVDRVRGRHRLGPGWVSLLLQRAVVRLWTDGAVDGAGVAAAYRARRELLIAALAERGVEAHGVSGMNVWVPVPDETGVVARLLHAGWAVAPGARFRLSAPPGVRITVSTLGVREAGPLADAVASALGPAPARSYV